MHAVRENVLLLALAIECKQKNSHFSHLSKKIDEKSANQKRPTLLHHSVLSHTHRKKFCSQESVEFRLRCTEANYADMIASQLEFRLFLCPCCALATTTAEILCDEHTVYSY